MKSPSKNLPSPPEISAAESLLPLQTLDLSSDADYGQFKLSACSLSDREVADVVIDCAEMTRVIFSRNLLDKCRLNDIRMQGCDLSNSVWSDCKLMRLELTDCKFTGFKIIDTQLTNVMFANCVGQLVQMCGSVLKKVVFRDCQLSGADFTNCNFEDVVFQRCDLREAVFYGAKLKGTNFCTSALSGLKAFAPDLQGAIIDQRQTQELAPQLAELLGIQVRKD